MPPSSRHPPAADPPEQTPPRSGHPPRADTLLEADTPLSRHPPGAETPPEQTPNPPQEQTPPSQSRHPPGKQTPAYGQCAAGTHPTGMHSCLDMPFEFSCKCIHLIQQIQ